MSPPKNHSYCSYNFVHKGPAKVNNGSGGGGTYEDLRQVNTFLSEEIERERKTLGASCTVAGQVMACYD